MVEKWQLFENGENWLKCKGYSLYKMVTLGGKLEFTLTWKNDSRTTLNLFCSKSSIQKRWIVEIWNNVEKWQKKLRTHFLQEKRKLSAVPPLDVALERCTKRCSPRVRPGGRFRCQVSDTCRQAGRGAKSAPKPYVRDPFHPLGLISIYRSFLYIYLSTSVISSKCYVKAFLSTVGIWQLRMYFAKTLSSRGW